jgi:hypothetical protein
MKDQPGPKNVDRAVHVGMICMPARDAQELFLYDTVLLSDMPALGAPSGGK